MPSIHLHARSLGIGKADPGGWRERGDLPIGGVSGVALTSERYLATAADSHSIVSERTGGVNKGDLPFEASLGGTDDGNETLQLPPPLIPIVSERPSTGRSPSSSCSTESIRTRPQGPQHLTSLIRRES